MLPRCFILRVHVRGEPFNDTARAGGSPLLPMRMHVIFLELNTTLNSSEKVSQMCKYPGALEQKVSATRHHRHNLKQNRIRDLCDNQI